MPFRGSAVQSGNVKKFTNGNRLRASGIIAGTLVVVALTLAARPQPDGVVAPAVCAAAELAPRGTTVATYAPGCPERYASLGKKTVLFFRAYWCGACADAAANIAAEAASGPDDLVVLEVDYDDSASLKRRYGVTLQHTFVQVDGEGEELGQWTGFGTLDELHAALR